MKVKCPKCSTQFDTADWLSKAGKSRWKGVTSKDRSTMAKKGWETRRALSEDVKTSLKKEGQSLTEKVIALKSKSKPSLHSMLTTKVPSAAKIDLSKPQP